MSKRKVAIINPDPKPLPVWIKVVFAVILILYAGIFASRQLNFLTADLGRHIANGRHLIETGEILRTNYYSYTQPDFPVVNHHWGAGLLFYALHAMGGFTGLGIFYVLCVVGAACFFVAAAVRQADVRIVFAVAVFLAPLYTSRAEIRPEGLSFLFLGILYYSLTTYRLGKLKPAYLLLIALLVQLLWVNTHIFFFMGFMLSGTFLLQQLFEKRDKERLRWYAILIVAQVVISLCNPFFIEGVLAPFTIFKEYGYEISENQSIPFLEAKAHDAIYTHYRAVLWLLALLLLPMVYSKKVLNSLYAWVPALLFGVLGYKLVRAIPLLGFVAIPAMAVMVQNLVDIAGGTFRKISVSVLAGTAGLLVLVGFISGLITYNTNKQPGNTYQPPTYFSPVNYYTGLGLIPGLDGSARFFIDNNLSGPIFNDYDLGGYIIYNLYGREKVFVDNRPEAYSVSFFRDTYIPMQEVPQKFRQIEGQYKFNCIWFYMREDSPWSRRFLWWVMRQSDYAPVYSDGTTIIFLKQNAGNEQLIKKFAIDKSMFSKGG